MTIFGWDASDYDWDRGSMNLEAAARDGIVFFSHKATEGRSVKHAHYGEALSRGKAAGISFLSAYHVVRSVNVPAQVDHFLGYVNAATPWWGDFPGWFFQVDLEKWEYDNVSAATGIAFADLLAQRTNRTVLLYASRGQYGNNLNGANHPLWNADYGANDTGHYQELYPGDSGRGWTPYSGQTPIIWQFGSKTTIGSQYTCDANAFRGTQEDFRRLIGYPGSPPVDPPGPNPDDPPWPGVYLRLGSQGTHVRTIQERLQQRGWRLSVDGDFGPETDRVVRAFQSEKQLESDGIVGPVTWKALWVAPIT